MLHRIQQSLHFPPLGYAEIHTYSQDQSEDCLSINIRTKPQSGERSSSELGYNGKFIADQTDFVLISLNYRLNIFVFPRNPATPANLGLMDRRLAMKRIRNNVEKFGGDVDRISVFGQSAGAGTIDFYSYAWAEDPIDNGFILLSATMQSESGKQSRMGNPLWRYRYFGDFPYLAVLTDLLSGAYHGSDLLLLFDTVSQDPIQSTQEQVTIGDYDRGACAAFAKDTSEGLLTYAGGWPQYVSTQETLIRLAYQNQTVPI
ncbi:hypothetical protein TruAng_002495 [Truncatella angustata]|nr:hypothetical protein TruAng_002495 [Truncatella angustata]